MAIDSSRQNGRRGGVKKPAAVSGPGKLSRRTDGVAPSIDDVRAMVSESAGEEKELVKQVREGNINAPEEETVVPAGQGQIISEEPGVITPIPGGVGEIFGQGDGTPINTFSSMQQKESTLLEPDDLMLIRAMVNINPTPELINLLQTAEQKINRTPTQLG